MRPTKSGEAMAQNRIQVDSQYLIRCYCILHAAVQTALFRLATTFSKERRCCPTLHHPALSFIPSLPPSPGLFSCLLVIISIGASTTWHKTSDRNLVASYHCMNVILKQHSIICVSRRLFQIFLEAMFCTRP